MNVPVAYGQVEISALSERVIDAADDLAAIRITDLFNKHPDRKRLLVAQRAGEIVRAVIELARGGRTR